MGSRERGCQPPGTWLYDQSNSILAVESAQMAHLRHLPIRKGLRGLSGGARTFRISYLKLPSVEVLTLSMIDDEDVRALALKSISSLPVIDDFCFKLIKAAEVQSDDGS